MTKFIGQQFNIGIGKESTRGTPITASYWLPNTTLTVDDKIKVAKDETSIGVIEDGVGQEVSNRYSEATIEGRATDQGFGLILMSLMGTDTVGAVETGVKDHVFTVLQTAQHPSLSMCVYEPNASTGLVYPLGMLDSLDITIDLDKYIMYKATYKANKNQSQANTVSYVQENAFRPQDMTFGYAPTLAGAKGTLTATGTAATTVHVTACSINPQTKLQVGMTVTGTNIPVGATVAVIVSATAYDLSIATTGAIGSQTFGPAPVSLKKVSLSFKANTEDDEVLGSIDPVDRLNKQFAVSGSFEAYYTDRKFIDTIMLGDLYEALIFKAVNTTVLLGLASNPTLTFAFARTKLSEVSRKIDDKGIVSQTMKFQAFYSLADTEMVDITLRNTVASGY